MPAWPTKGGGADEEHVERVKALQRADHEGKLKWMSYTMLNGGGKHDPKAHSNEYIDEFFRLFEADQVEIDPKIRGAAGPIVGNELFVGHLPQDIDETVISDYFCEWGQVLKVEYKEGRGFAFVTFADESEVRGVLDNREVHSIRDQWVDVKLAEDRRKGNRDNSMYSSGGGKGKGYGKDSYSNYGYGGGDYYDEPRKGSKGGSYGKGGGSYGGYGGGKKGDAWGGKNKSMYGDDDWYGPPPSKSMGKGGSKGGYGGKGGKGKRSSPY